MRISKLVLINWRQHRRFEVEFGDFTIIRGPNGSGKTNLVDAVIFALTGHGGDQSSICQWAAQEEEAKVTLHFRHREEACCVERTIPREPGRPTAVLTKNDEEIRGIRNVNQAISGLLGIDEKLIRQYLFVPQWEIFAFVSSTDAARAAIFGRLFGTEKAERINKLIGETKLPETLVTIDGQAVAARAEQLAQLLAEQKLLLENVSAQHADLLAGRAARRQLLADFDRAEIRRRDLASAITNESMCRESARLAANTCADIGPQIEKLRQEISSLRDLAKNFESNEQAWREYDFWAASRQQMFAQHAADLAALKNMQDAEPSMDGVLEPVVAEQAHKNRQLADIEIAKLQAFLASFDARTGFAACPTCLTPSSAFQDRLAEAKVTLPKWQQYRQQLDEQIAKTDTYVQRKQLWERNVSACRQLVARGEANLLAWGTRQPPAGERQKVPEGVTSLKALDERLRGLEAVFGQATASQTKAEAAADQAARTRVSLEEELGKLTYATQEARQTAIAQENRLTDLIAEMESVKAHLAVLNREDEQNRAAKEMFEQQKRQWWIDRNVAEYVGRLRAQFHRDGLPAKVHAHFLDKIIRRIDTVLAVFNKQFRVDGLDGIRFRFRFVDGRLHGEDGLSGGEKVVFAIAFRFAVNTAVADELGILFLDEPTAGLDEDTTARLQDAFQELRDVCRASGLQLGLITHERGFDAPCDKIIDLAGGDPHVESGCRQAQPQAAAG